MKKPVKLTGEALQEVIDKRKHKKIRVEKSLPTGTFASVTKAFKAFAEANGVDVSEVKYHNPYYGSGVMYLSRLETDEEKARRVRDEETDKYRTKKWEYDQWTREQAEIAARAAAQQARQQFINEINNKKPAQQCCPSDCCCRRK